MKPRKVCVVITARPSYSRVKSLLSAVLENSKLELQIVVAASALLDRYGKVENTIKNDGFEIAARVHMVLEGDDPIAMSKTTGIGVVELSTVFSSIEPDVVVTIADRYETIATAIAATYMNIPLVHIQGGEVTGSIDERVRHSITKLADFHFPSTKLAEKRIIRMGENPANIFNVGCPSIDLAVNFNKLSVKDLNVVISEFGVGADLELEDSYFVVMQHPVTDENHQAETQVKNLIEAVNDLGVQAVWFWPNVDSGSDATSRGIRHFREINPNSNIRFIKNLEPAQFLSLLSHSKGIVGNSSVGIRECSFLGIPCINIGNRQKMRERGTNVVDVSYEYSDIYESLKMLLQDGLAPIGTNIYGDGTAGKRMADIISNIELYSEKRFFD